jgi:hypothetical protein
MNNIHLHIIGSKPFYNLLNELDPNYTFSADGNSKYNNKNNSLYKKIEVKKYLVPALVPAT